MEAKFENGEKLTPQKDGRIRYENKCDLVICLSHPGLHYSEKKVCDLDLAAETSMTDLIVCDHTHTYLKKPLSLKNKNGEEVIVNQASWGGLVVGKLDFVFEKSRKNKKAVIAEIPV